MTFNSWLCCKYIHSEWKQRNSSLRAQIEVIGIGFRMIDLHLSLLCQQEGQTSTYPNENQQDGQFRNVPTSKRKTLFDSLTPKSILTGMKNSRSEGFWLAKHKHTNIPTMMEQFPPPAAWF